MASSTKASSFTLGIVADTGGLNDHGFNHLAYEGLIEAVNKLGIKKQVLQAQSSADYVPFLPEGGRARRQARRRGRLRLHRRRWARSPKEFPHTNFAIIDTTGVRDQGQA